MIPLRGDPLNGRARCRKATWAEPRRGEFARLFGGDTDLDRPQNIATPLVLSGCVVGRRLPAVLAQDVLFWRSTVSTRLSTERFFSCMRTPPLSKVASRSSHPSTGHAASRVGRPDVRSDRRDARPTAAEPLDEALDDHEFEADARPLQEDEIDEAIEDEQAVEQTGGDDQIDDPVRIYLMQMGEIPMLSRREERAVAQRIVRSRRRFRYCMLATDYILHAAMGLLESVRDNKLRLDRTMEVSVVNVGEKSRLLKVLAPNLRTLGHLLLQNKRDFALAIARRQPAKCRRAGLAAAVEPPREGGPAD